MVVVALFHTAGEKKGAYNSVFMFYMVKLGLIKYLD